jgi:L-fuculose-phosphate aldolase
MTPRDALLEATLRVAALGLNHGATGNLSVRTHDRMLITPTGVPYDRLAAPDLVEVTSAGAVTGPGTPSSEWRLHAAVYAARPDVGAVVHTHSRFATTIACLREDLPPVHYMIAVAGTDRIRCAAYAPFGSEELATMAVAALGSAGACLLANHGLVAVGRDLDGAVRIAAEVEVVAEYWWRARAVGPPVLLSGEEMAEAMRRFEGYGKPPSAPSR